MRRLLMVVGILGVAITASLEAQGLRGKLAELFIFGEGEDPLFLAGTADLNNPTAIQAHSNHFVPAAAQGNAALIGFLTDAIGISVANVPLSATAGGATFQFVGGVPVQTSISPGPIFAERAQTLGRGRIFVGATVNLFNLKSLRGVRLDNVQLNFTHVNADFPGCDTIFGGDCSRVGIPTLENDVIRLKLDLDLNVRVTHFLLTYGLLDRVDVGVAIPLVFTSLRGRSTAEIVPFGGPTAAHFFAGTTTNPQLQASRFVEGSSSGLGDVAVRVKANLSRRPDASFSVLGDVRFATGSAEDLLGSGSVAARGLAVFSARFDAFSPHANVGYLFRDGDTQNDAVLVTVGFDQLLGSWVTLAADLVSELQVRESKLRLPSTVVIDEPFRRTVEPSNIPDVRDDLIDAALGFKFTTGAGVTIITNAMWPLNSGGLRPDVLWTVGLEYAF